MSLGSMRPGWIPKTSICLQKLPYMATRFFMWTNQLQQEGAVDKSCMQKTLWTQIERKSSATCTKEIIHVGVNSKNAVLLKLVLKYRNTKITAADDDEFYTMLEEILLSQYECVIMGDFNLPHIDWTLLGPTPSHGNKLIQPVVHNNLTQHVHETTRHNHILDLVISTSMTWP